MLFVFSGVVLLLFQGAFYGIAIGHTIGIIRMGIDLAYPAPDCGDPETRPDILLKVHYTYFGTLNVFITSIVMVVISLLTTAQPEEEVRGITIIILIFCDHILI